MIAPADRPLAAALDRPRGGPAAHVAEAAEGEDVGTGSLAKGLAVLALLARSTVGLRLSDVATELGLTRATARRSLLQLVALGYARQDGRLFFATPRVVALAVGQLGMANPWTIAEPALVALSSDLGESVSVAVLDGSDICYVARAATRRILSVTLKVGSRLPAAYTSMGRVLLAALPPAEARRVLEHSELRAHTPKSRTTVDDIAAELGRVGCRGYALVDEELELGLRSVAVPIRDATGRVVAALNAGMPAAARSVGEIVDSFVPRLSATAEEVSRLMFGPAAGGQP
jgi:IclR family pca regulon transcriptional regulator